MKTKPGTTKFTSIARGNGVKDLLARSHKATCGISEREVIVSNKMMGRRISQLEKAGFHVIGTSYGGAPKKIWFIRRGGL